MPVTSPSSPPSGSDDNEATYNVPLEMGVGDTFVSSILINKTTSGLATGTTRAFQLGFSNGPNVRPFTNSTTPPNGFVSTRINYAGTATGNYQLEIQHRTSAAGAPVVNTAGTGAGNTPTTLLDNRFYLFRVDITEVSTVEYTGDHLVIQRWAPGQGVRRVERK